MKKQTAQILGGLAVGAAGALAMYLLDPVSGRRRRQLALDKVAQARDKTAEAIHDQAKSVRIRAEDLAERLRTPDEAAESAVESPS